MKFYTNTKTGEIRIVKELGSNWFAVVKLVRDGVYTLKIWHGDLTKTASYWNTKPFTPSQSEVVRLTKAYHSIVNKMRPQFTKL